MFKYGFCMTLAIWQSKELTSLQWWQRWDCHCANSYIRQLSRL